MADEVLATPLSDEEKKKAEQAAMEAKALQSVQATEPKIAVQPDAVATPSTYIGGEGKFNPANVPDTVPNKMQLMASIPTGSGNELKVGKVYDPSGMHTDAGVDNTNPPNYGGRRDANAVAAPRGLSIASTAPNADPYGIAGIEQIKGNVIAGGPRALDPLQVDQQLRNQFREGLATQAAQTQRVAIPGTQEQHSYAVRGRHGEVHETYPVGDFKYKNEAANLGAVHALQALGGGDSLAKTNLDSATAAFHTAQAENYPAYLDAIRKQGAQSKENDPISDTLRQYLKDPNSITDEAKAVLEGAGLIKKKPPSVATPTLSIGGSGSPTTAPSTTSSTDEREAYLNSLKPLSLSQQLAEKKKRDLIASTLTQPNSWLDEFNKSRSALGF